MREVSIRLYKEAADSLASEVRTRWKDSDLMVEDDMYGERWKRGRTLAALASHQPNLYGDLAMWDAYAFGRYELFCRKLVLERHYSASAFITSCAEDGPSGAYATPADDLSLERFARVLVGHLAAFV